MIEIKAIIENLEKLEDNIKEECKRVSYETGADMELYAKVNAPWKDRTGNARRELHGRGAESALGFSAQIWQDLYGLNNEEYGYTLETAEYFHGKYSILKKTQRHFKDIYFANLKDILESLFK